MKKTSRKPRRPSRKKAEQAVETLLLWAGEDPRREGLIDTPKRVASAYEDWFAGYNDDPVNSSNVRLKKLRVTTR